MNITLIGMPGAGKSHIARMLALHLEYACLDIDEILEKEHRLPLPQVVAKLGDKKFLQREAEIVISQTRGRKDLVISPGGSMVYRAQAMKHLRNISKIVYLEAPLSVIEQRISTAPRGIIGAKSKTLAEIYAERVPLYQKYAEYTVHGEQSAEKVVSDILQVLPVKKDESRAVY